LLYPFPKEESFDGYILSGPEFLVLSEDIIMSNGNIIYPDNSIWVEADDQISKLFYDNAYKLEDSNNYGVSSVLKIKFEGRYYKNGNYGHLGKYNSMVKINKVLDYSNKIPGLNI